MKSQSLSRQDWVERVVVGLVFVAFATLIILVFSPWRPLIAHRMTDYLGRIGVAAALLAVVILTYRSKRLEKYRPVMAGLLILSVVVSLDWIFGKYLLVYLGVSDADPSGWAIIKLNEGFIVIAAILLLNRTARGSLSSIYIQKGKLKLGLVIGAITFLLAAASSIPMAALFKADNLTLDVILPWIPWILIYVLVNGTMEELMFRGLFLRKLQPFLGMFLSNFLVAFVFTGLHGSVTYSADNMIFLAVTFPLALLWGYIMQKTDSLWGSALFHAGMDIPIMLGIFANL